MKVCFALSVGALLASGVAFADSTEVTSDTGSSFNTTLSFSQEDRIALGDGGGSKGWYLLPNVGINVPNDVAVSFVTFSFDPGLSLGLGIGKEFRNGFAVQLDVGYMKNNIDRVSAFGVSVSPATFGRTLEVEQLPIMLSGIWTNTNADFSPYLGFGLGTTRGEITMNGTIAGIPFDQSAVEWAFAYQLMIGIRWHISPTNDFSLGYRFLHADYDNNLDLNNHTINAGIQFRF